MLHRKLLAKITIPNYIRKVKLSKAQRPKYYEWDGVTIKCKSKKLLQKYIEPAYKKSIIRNDGNVEPHQLAEGYFIIGFKGNKVYSILNYVNDEVMYKNTWTAKQEALPLKYFLCNVVNNEYTKIIANETQAGTPKEHIINGQAFYNQTLNPFARIKVMEDIKAMYYNKFNNIEKSLLDKIKLNLNSNYPLYIEMEIKDTIKSEYDRTKEGYGRRWDVGNRAEPYMKGFLDFLVNGYISGDLEEGLYDMEPLIEDDDRLHVVSGNNSYFTPITELDTRAIVFHIYKDTREFWKPILIQ